jgi:hypothetical protein
MVPDPSAADSTDSPHRAHPAARPRRGGQSDFTEASAAVPPPPSKSPWVSVEEARARHQQLQASYEKQGLPTRTPAAELGEKKLPDEEKRRAFAKHTEPQIDEGHRGFGHQRRELSEQDQEHLAQNWTGVRAAASTPEKANEPAPAVESFWSIAWPTSWMYDAQHRWRLGRTLIGLIILSAITAGIWAWRTGGLRSILP